MLGILLKVMVMGEIQDISRGFEEGRRLYGEIIENCSRKFDYVDESILSRGDNASLMVGLLQGGYAGRIQSVYVDPPFFTKSKFNATISVKDAEGKTHKIHHLAYDDTFERNLEFYIANMTMRLMLIKDLLADDGLLWVHLDWHSSHYIKLVLDEIMGEKNFVNEIIWKYKSGGSGKRHFSKKHDSILVYSKTTKYYLDVPKEKSYNRDLKPYRFKGVDEYKDEYGWYTLVNMKDVWSIDMVGRTSKERTGYATQKPMELMRRIIRASTKEGDLCADFFCGSGSYIEAAEELGRRWIGCDTEKMALSMTRKRLNNCEAEYVYYDEADDVTSDEVEFIINSKDELESGKNLYSFSVSYFKPNVDIGHIPLKERALAEKISEESPLSFIDCIFVDPAYNGSFKPDLYVTTDFDNIRCISRGNVAFEVIDVFGNNYFYTL